MPKAPGPKVHITNIRDEMLQLSGPDRGARLYQLPPEVREQLFLTLTETLRQKWQQDLDVTQQQSAPFLPFAEGRSARRLG